MQFIRVSAKSNIEADFPFSFYSKNFKTIETDFES